MNTPDTASAFGWTVADLFDHFGPVTHARIRQDPPPGTATEQDVIEIHDREDRLYELADGVLVEKVMGVQESFLAVLIGRYLDAHAELHDLGFVQGADGMARLAPGLVRIPDVAFISWSRCPTRKVPSQPMLDFAPDLAVEVLSPSNTQREMQRKLGDYFGSGVAAVWYVDPVKRQVQVYTAVDRSTLVTQDQVLTGEPVLPGFTLNLRELFARLDR